MTIENEAGTATGPGLKGVLTRMVSGFIFGVGFSIALVLVAWSGNVLMKWSSGEGDSKSGLYKSWRKHFTPEAGVVIESHESRKRGPNLIILGSVRNGGTDSWNLVHLEAQLLDGRDKLVGICRGHVNGPLRPGQSRYFSIDCEGSQWEPVPEHTRYAVEVVDAHYEPDDGA